MEIVIDVHESGAVFNGVAEAAAHDFVNAAREAVAERGLSMVRAHLDSVLKVNTGVYVGFAHLEYEGDTIVLTDRWIVYGPWLEGVGSRVGPPGSGKWPYTRFEGYHTYRIVAGELDLISGDIAESVLPPYLALMNS